MPLHEYSIVIKIAAVPLAVGIVIAVSVGGMGFFLRALFLAELSRNVGRGIPLHESSYARLPGKIGGLA